VQVHGLAQTMVAHAYHLLELKSDGKISIQERPKEEKDGAPRLA